MDVDRSVHLEGRSIRFGQEWHLKLAHPTHAQSLIRSLETYRARGSGEAARKRWIAERLDVAGCRRRWRSLLVALRLTRWAGWLEFGLVFLAVPLVFTFGAPVWIWLVLVSLIVICHLFTCVCLLRAPPAWGSGHRNWRQLVLFVVAPTHAMRGALHSNVNAFVGYHPISMILAASPEAGHGLLMSSVRDLRYPPEPRAPEDPESREVVEGFRSAVLRSLKPLARRSLAKARQKDRAPRAEGGARRFCPRCLAQFVSADGCHHCGGRPLETFGDGS